MHTYKWNVGAEGDKNSGIVIWIYTAFKKDLSRFSMIIYLTVAEPT